MEQRPLRLGNIVDDYCPRERRLTNHVIVAIVDQTIRQTRCSTCDAEHPYKEAKVPRKKKDGVRDEAGLADLAGGQLVVARAQAAEPAEPESVPEPMPVAPPAAPVMRQPEATPVAMAAAAPAVSSVDEPSAPESEHAWSGHRRLIRATLPKVEGEQPPARPIPEFTMHQRPQSRGGHGFRQHGQPWHGGNGHTRNGNGFRPERDGNVITPPRPGGGGGGGGRRRHRGRHKPPR